MLTERSFSLDEANSYFHEEINRLNISVKSNSLLADKFGCFYSELFHKETNISASCGYGKGTSKMALLGSKFEALENYTSIASNLNIEYENISFEELITRKNQIIRSKIFSQILLEEKYQKISLPWTRYQNYFNPADYTYVPIASINPLYLDKRLSDDIFPYEEIYIESTNNGVAIGCSLDEAIVHATLEIIERDAASIFLIKNFISDKNHTIKIINAKKLTGDNLLAYNFLKNNSKQNPIIIFLENDFNIPAFCTYIANSNVPIVGFGASQSTEYALHRSLLECIEQKAINDSLKLQNLSYATIFPTLPKFRDCMKFNLRQLIKRKPIEKIVLEDDEQNLKFLDLKLYKEQLMQKIREKGFSIYYKILYQSEMVCTVQVIIPEADESISILHGMLSHFSERGKSEV